MKSLIPSRLTILWAFGIFISALSGRQVSNWIIARGGSTAFDALVWAGFLAIAYGTWRLRPEPRISLRTALTLAAGIIYAATLQFHIERVHLVMYGVLGFLARRDFKRGDTRYSSLRAVVFGTLIAALDELLQWGLPYRVGDIRDVRLGAIGSLWGAALAAALSVRR